jgi:group I intron endonuclease
MTHAFHLLYKTTNIITGKFYIGIHSTNNLEDGYLGSGILIARSLKKYGKENHKIEIIEYCTDRVSLVEKEKAVVTLDLLNNPDCMNLALGGFGGVPGINISQGTRQKLSELSKGRKLTIGHKDKIGLAQKGKRISEIQIEKFLQTISNSEKYKERCRHIIIDGIEYDSIRMASQVLGIPHQTISKRCLSENFIAYQFTT